MEEWVGLEMKQDWPFFPKFCSSEVGAWEFTKVLSLSNTFETQCKFKD